MKKIYSIACAAALLATACMREPESSPHPEADFNRFDFATVDTYPLSIDYGAMGGIRTNVYFEVYDTPPVAPNATGTGYVPVAGVTPLFADYTDEDGRYEGRGEFPSYAKKVYVYTPAFYAQTLLEATLVNGVLTAAVAEEEPQNAAVTRASHESLAVTRDGWKTWLGDYDATYGRIRYAYLGTELRVEDYAKLYKAHSSVFDTTKSCPSEYRSSRDLLIEKDAEVAVTILGGNTCWNSSMGYYFYKEGQKPASLKDAHIVMIYPNTQDGEWSNNIKVARKYRGVSRGTAVQLKFFPDIARGSKEGAQDWFPAGYRIGFVLATNAWTNRIPGFGGDKSYRAATSDGLSIDNNGTVYQSPRTAVFRYTDKANDIDAVLFSFEDHVDDENFSDVVFTMVSNPLDAVVDIPEIEVEDSKKTARMLKGVYAFEDLWPSQGDYDLNDVMLRSNYEKVFNEKGIYEESFLLTTYTNYAGLENGLAVTLECAARSAKLTYSVLRPGAKKYEPAAFERDGDVLLLTENVKDEQEMGSTYKITAEYGQPVDEKSAGRAKPFIYSTKLDNIGPGRRWEVHIPNEAPSDKAEFSFFGTSDDKSIPEKHIYYVRNSNYPFAFFLAGANDTDVAKMLDPKNEKTQIDLLYPGYTGWVTSNGSSNTNWYKE